ncbi:MAG: DUF4142 domain-containing protein [Chitinophagaceae bacterium]|nr:DUF4142 domain-containing protein [Chitinophagaceae bacterium]
MKGWLKHIIALLLIVILSTVGFPADAQAIDPDKSAKAAALSDERFIGVSIENSEDALFLSQHALKHTNNARIRDLSQVMEEDNTAMLYSMEQLQAAGTGTSKKKTGGPGSAQRPAVILNNKLASLSGGDFDTTWTSGMVILQQARYDELVKAKETVTNTQLKMAITEAIPLIRKHLTQLRSIQKYLEKLAIQQKKLDAAHQKRKQQ